MESPRDFQRGDRDSGVTVTVVAPTPQKKSPGGSIGKKGGQQQRHHQRHERTMSYFDGWVETVRKNTFVDQPFEDEDDEETEKEEQERRKFGVVEGSTHSDSAIAPAPSSSGTSSSFPRYNSFPPLRAHQRSSASGAGLSAPAPADLSGMLSPLMGGSIASTPSATSASSPSPSSQSPSSPPHSLPMSPSADFNVSALLGLDEGALDGGGSRTSRMVMDDERYNVFLNR